MSREPKKPRKCFVLVHLSSIGSYADEGGDADGLTSDWVMSARDADRVIVIDQGWDGRWERKARRELSESMRTKPSVWIAHDEGSDDPDLASWDRMEDDLVEALSEARCGSVSVGGLWKDDCVSETVSRLSRRGFSPSVDVDATRGFDDIEAEDDEDEDE